MRNVLRERGSCHWQTQPPPLIKKKKMSPRASSARGRRTSWPSSAGTPAVCLSLRTWTAGESYRWPKVRYSGGFLRSYNGDPVLGILQSLGGSSRCRKPERLVLCGHAAAAVCCCCLLHLRTPPSCYAGRRLPNRYSLAAALRRACWFLPTAREGGPRNRVFVLVLIVLAYMRNVLRERGSCHWQTQPPPLIKKKKMSPRASSARGRRTSWPSSAGTPAVCLSLRTWTAGESYRWPKVRYSGGFLRSYNGDPVLGILQSLGGSSRCRKPERLVLCGHAAAAVCCCCLLHLRTPPSCYAGRRLPNRYSLAAALRRACWFLPTAREGGPRNRVFVLVLIVLAYMRNVLRERGSCHWQTRPDH